MKRALVFLAITFGITYAYDSERPVAARAARKLF